MPKAGVGDQYNICKGNVTTILPSESLEVMTDIHLYIDGLVPMTYGHPFNLKKVNGLTLITAIVLLVMTRVHLLVTCTEFLVSFQILPKGLRNNSLSLISQRKW